MRKLILLLALIVSTQCFASIMPHRDHIAYSHLSELYRSFDPKNLTSENEDDIKKFISEKAPFIRDYIKDNYNEDFSSLSDEQVFAAGLAVVAIEEDNPTLDSKTAPYLELGSPGDTFNCLIAAIGSVTGIQSLVASIQGATMATVVGVVKTIFSTYISSFLAVWAIWEFGDCMGWW